MALLIVDNKSVKQCSGFEFSNNALEKKLLALNKVALIGGKWVKRPNFVEDAVQLFHALGQKLSTNFVDSLKVCDRNHRELQNIAIFRLATVAPEQNPPKILFSSIQIFFWGAGGSPYP